MDHTLIVGNENEGFSRFIRGHCHHLKQTNIVISETVIQKLYGVTADTRILYLQLYGVYADTWILHNIEAL